MLHHDLTTATDDELYALEQARELDPDSWSDIDAELRRRRQSRGASPADVIRAPANPPTVRDVERVAGSLEATLEGRLDIVESRIRGLRWWVFITPAIWLILTVGAWIALTWFAPDLVREMVLVP